MANFYCCQPLLGDIAATFRAGSNAVTPAVTATQISVAAGFFLLAPREPL